MIIHLVRKSKVEENR